MAPLKLMVCVENCRYHYADENPGDSFAYFSGFYAVNCSIRKSSGPGGSSAGVSVSYNHREGVSLPKVVEDNVRRIFIVAAYVRPVSSVFTAPFKYLLKEKLIGGLKTLSLPLIFPLIITGSFNVPLCQLDLNRTSML